MAKRFLKNKETGVIFNHNEYMATLDHMVDCTDEVEVEQAETPTKLEDMTWQAVKKIVLEEGGEWTDKAAGIAFLRSE